MEFQEIFRELQGDVLDEDPRRKVGNFGVVTLRCSWRRKRK